MADYKRSNYLRREAELAHRNAKAAETVEVEAAPAPKAEEVNEESNKEEVAE